MFRLIRILFIVSLILVINAQAIFAALTDAAPEIDPSMAPSAIMLLSGGLLILKNKIERK